MLVTFKLVKNSLKFLLCFTMILLLYYNQNYFTTKPQKWTLPKTLRRFRSKATEALNETRILPNVKYILIWNKGDTFAFLEKGQSVFINNKCVFTNCFVSTHRNMLFNDYSNFHAIILDGKKVAKTYVDGYMKLPKKRHPRQIYIFAMQDDAVTYPVCSEKFDNYFNMTWTYKLNSDAKWLHFNVLTRHNEIVAPKINANWTLGSHDNNSIFSNLQAYVSDKEFYAVWTSSICETQSRREEIVKQIKYESKKNDNILHTAGVCGSKECSFATQDKCLSVYDNYIFYLAFEAVLTEDYVSSEILDAFDHHCVPVVYGGADYSRFLPPYSYIDARKLGGEATARLMGDLQYNVTQFFEYHEWRSAFKIERDVGQAACNLCEALNKHDQKVYKDFREWWSPDYRRICKMKRKRQLFKRSSRRKAVESSTVKPSGETGFP